MSHTGRVHIVGPADRVVQLEDLHARYMAGEALDVLGGEVKLAGKTLLGRFRDAGMTIRPRGKPARRQPGVAGWSATGITGA